MTFAVLAEIAEVCRFALLNTNGGDRPVFSHSMELNAADHDGVIAVFTHYLATIDKPWPKILGLAIAGRATEDAFTIPQSGWASSHTELKKTFGFEQSFALNRPSAAAISLSWLEPSGALPIGSLEPLPAVLPAGRYAIVSADTGLGVSGAQIDASGRCTALCNEAGHMSFAPTNDFEIELFKRLTAKYGRVSFERAISWSGLAEIFATLCVIEGAEPRNITPLEIVLYGRTGADLLCVSALNRFCEILGDFAGDVALATGADQGVFLTGRFVHEAREAMSGSHFRQRFERKGRLSPVLIAMPTWAMTGRTTILAGIARHVVDTLRDNEAGAAPTTASPVPAERQTPVSAAKSGELEHLTTVVFNGLGSGLLVLDADLNIVASNDRYWAGSSVSPSQRAPGSPIQACFDAMAQGRNLTQDTLAKVLAGLQGRLPFEAERTAFGGGVLRDEAVPSPDGGWVFTAHDITISRRRAVELESITQDLRTAKSAADAANGAKTAFLATMSHEIRTPLNGVLGMAQAMAADELTPSQSERLEIIRQSGESLLAILNDILDLSKIEAGKLELEEVEFDLDQLLMGAHSTFTAVANKKGLSFCLATDESARGVYLGDPTRLRQVLYNLVSNAIKFTATGEVRVTTAYGEKQLRMTVKDTGIGIPQDRIDTLFDKFTQVDASTTRQYGGTGLGLSICQNLAALMGGEINVTSEMGEGTSFEFVLPIQRLGDAQATGYAKPEYKPVTEEVAELRILAAEDNTVNQLVLKTLLHQMGVEVTVVSDGEEAVEAWEREHWDIILMDVQMPKMDGPTAVGVIRKKEAATGRRRTPIIALTANVMTHQITEYLAVGMDAAVGKPLQIATLMQAMNDVLDAAEEETPEAMSA